MEAIVEKMNILFGSFGVPPIYIQAGLIVILLFLLVLSIAQYRHHFVKGSLKGGVAGLFFGIIFTLIIEGFLLTNGSTILTTVFKWKNAPKPLSTVLDLGKDKLTKVLGEESTNQSSKDVITIMQSLNPDEIKRIKAIICEP